ncbi:MAG TPA: hypothetical protein VGK12_05025 [Actinomycetota bacterium]
MGVPDASSSSIRTSIEAVLEQAREQWDRPSPDGHAEDVLLVATFDDAYVRIKARVDAALERARDLAEAGWHIELRDAADRLLEWDGAVGLRLDSVDPPAPAAELPLASDTDLPPLPALVVERLRDTA